MQNKAMIEVSELLCGYLDVVTSTYMLHLVEDYGAVVSKDLWEILTTADKKALVVAKAQEVNELYPNSPLYGAYEEIYTTIVEEGVEGLELEWEIEQFAADVIFRDYSQNDIKEMVKDFSIANIDD